MSKQFDEYMEGRFEIYGTEYELIAPDSAKELSNAIETKRALETCISAMMHDEDSSGYEELLQEQKDYIQEYIEGIGEFDNSTLAANIAYLAKENGLRVGDLEEALGISAGYISRTIKENSKKKMSIDTVWKIAQLFNTDVNTLLQSHLWDRESNTSLLEVFLDKLYFDTRDNYLTWEYDGGLMIMLNDRYEEMGLLEEEDTHTVIYHLNHPNPDIKWVLDKDVVCVKNFEGEKDLVMIPFVPADRKHKTAYDFIFIWKVGETWKWEKVFYTSDTPFGQLEEKSQRLYNLIESRELDAKITPKIQKVITDYIKGGRPD